MKGESAKEQETDDLKKRSFCQRAARARAQG